MLSNLAERLNMSGTLAFRDKAGNLHQTGIRYGCLISNDGKVVGGIDANGQVDFNKEGQRKFNVDQKLDIKTTDGAVFHSEDPTRADIVSEKSQGKGNESWSGTFLDLQNQAKYKCVAGNIFDLKGNLIGSFDEIDKIDRPMERSTTTSKDDLVGAGGETEDINTLLGEGLTFIGQGKNKDGADYPLYFTTGPDLHSGTWKVPKNPGQIQPQYENYNVRLGMVFDSKDNFSGYFKPPRFNADGSLAEEGQVLRKSPKQMVRNCQR